MSEINVNDILAKVQAEARKKGEALTYTNMRVYLKLIEYAKENCNKDTVVDYRNGIKFNLTTAGFSKYCDVAPRMITDTLNKLNECGVIKYTINKPKPSVVILFKNFFEQNIYEK